MSLINKKTMLFLLILFITTIWYIPIINLPPGVYDEGIILVGAERILKGEIPHRDFFSLYFPGQIYTLAGIFRLFGTSILTERIYDIIIKASLSFTIFLITRFLSSNLMALIGWAMSLLWITISSFPGYAVYPSLLFAYLGIYFILVYIKQGGLSFVILSAIIIVLATLFRQDIGGFAGISITILLILKKLNDKEKGWLPLVYYIVGGITGILTIVLYFYLNSAIKPMFNDLIVYPLTEFTKYRNLPYPPPSLSSLPFYTFPATLFSGLLVSVFFMKRKIQPIITYGIFLISLFGILCLNQVRIRSDLIHLLPIALTSILLSPILIHNLPIKPFSGNKLRMIIWMSFFILSGITLYKPVVIKFPSLPWDYTIKVTNPDIQRAKYLKLSESLRDAVVYIMRNTPEEEYIYVGVKNHDRLVINHPIIYFIAERNCPARFHGFDPNLTETIQNDVVTNLKEKAVRLIVLTPEAPWEEPSLNKTDEEIDIIDNYIANNFELKERFGLYEIWVKTPFR
ncbi:MAG: hypothetical protein QXP41_01930 [Candidatus Nitrosocaldus sp.]